MKKKNLILLLALGLILLACSQNKKGDSKETGSQLRGR